MKLIKDIWLSDIFNYDVFKLDITDNENGPIKLPTTKSFVWAKIPVNRIDLVDLLSSLNFRVVDVNVTFEINKKKLDQNKSIDNDICEFTQGDENKILDIAESGFVYSRFHLDPNISNVTANSIKKMWIKNYLDKKRGERLLIVKDNNNVAGFLAELKSKKENKLIGIIDLISIDKNFQGKSLGKKLVNYWLNDCYDKYDVFKVGTQIANIPSIKLYESCGFRLSDSLYIMHLHIN